MRNPRSPQLQGRCGEHDEAEYRKNSHDRRLPVTSTCLLRRPDAAPSIACHDLAREHAALGPLVIRCTGEKGAVTTESVRRSLRSVHTASIVDVVERLRCRIILANAWRLVRASRCRCETGGYRSRGGTGRCDEPAASNQPLKRPLLRAVFVVHTFTPLRVKRPAHCAGQTCRERKCRGRRAVLCPAIA